jgi:FlaA1/EpsC-like NDP-sugar epimerase
LPTAHPRILRAQEERFDWSTLSGLLDQLHSAVQTGNRPGARGLLQKLVRGYQPDAAAAAMSAP